MKDPRAGLMPERTTQSGRLGLRGKVVLFILLYTVTALAVISVFAFRYVQAREVDVFHRLASLRFSLWKMRVGAQIRDHRVPEPPSNADAPGFSGSLGGDPKATGVGLYAIEAVEVEGAAFVLQRSQILQGTGLPETLHLEAMTDELRADRTGVIFIAPIVAGGQRSVLYCRFAYPETMVSLTKIYGLLAQVGAVLAIVALLLGLAAHLTVVRPVERLTRATECVAQGDLDQWVQIETGDEFEYLSKRFNEMLGRIQYMQEIALDASPLTGLPGNNSIAACLEAVLQEEEAVVVFHADIDSFKAYNDVYGFEAGDRAILHTAQQLEQSLRDVCQDNGFLGHVGGDDFVVVLPAPQAEAFAVTACRVFDANAAQLYHAEDAARGYIRAQDRQGQIRDFPLMSISLAGVPLVPLP